MFGAGDYKDFQRPQLDPYVFNNGAAIGSTASAIAAINAWTAPSGSGSDGPEGELFALHQIATDPSIGLRPDSTRVVVWFGDAPGHDPVCTGFTGLASNITTSSVSSELMAAHIRVIAVSLNTGGYANGLNDDQLFGGFEFDYDAVCGAPGSVSARRPRSRTRPAASCSRSPARATSPTPSSRGCRPARHRHADAHMRPGPDGHLRRGEQDRHER